MASGKRSQAYEPSTREAGPTEIEAKRSSAKKRAGDMDDTFDSKTFTHLWEDIGSKSLLYK